MSMSEKAKPRLHLVRGGDDPGIYCEDLDWYFGCYDAECGLKSIGISNVLDVAVMGTRSGMDEYGDPMAVSITRDMQKWYEGGPWNDHHAQFKGRGEHCAFTRGRRIWNRLQAIPWPIRELLRSFYEARQLWSRDETYWQDGVVAERHVKLDKPVDAVVRAAHGQYYLANSEAA